MTRREVLDLELALIATFAAQMDVRRAIPIAARIKFPAVPARFSESIVVLAANRLFAPYTGYTAAAGGKLADVILTRPSDSAVSALGVVPAPTVKVEVKATASRGTLELKPRDVSADILVWLSFGDRFEGGRDPITVHVLPKPTENPSVQKVAGRVVKLAAFVAAAGRSPGYTTHVHEQLNTLV